MEVMGMYKKILVPLDGSEFAGSSLDHVKAIATGCHVPEVILMSVMEPVPQAGVISNYLGSDWQVEREKWTVNWLEEYLNKAAVRLAAEGLNVKTAIVQGNTGNEILEYAGKHGVDLIVMTTHGRSGVLRWALGSVADRVMRHSLVPVMLIRPDEG
jgi:nucleotide-binding universal stress UspA family protein